MVPRAPQDHPQQHPQRLDARNDQATLGLCPPHPRLVKHLERFRAMLRSNQHWVLLAAVAGVAGAGQRAGGADQGDRYLLKDSLASVRHGPLMPVVGPSTEYHFVPEAINPSPWAVTTFDYQPATQIAWRVVRDDHGAALKQEHRNRAKHWHPMVVAGDPAWRDYTFSVQIEPSEPGGRVGVAVRQLHDRSYLFVGIDSGRAVILRVEHEVAFHVPGETELAAAPITPDDEPVEITVNVMGDRIAATVGRVSLRARDATFEEGRIALISDAPATFRKMEVRCDPAEHERLTRAIAQREELRLAAASRQPRPTLWRRFKTPGHGADRNLRFGDLDGDGVMEIVIGQIEHHGPSDSNSEISCLTAVDLNGKKLWQVGKPDAYRHHLTNDVAFQVHDLDGDGRCEVIYCRGMKVHVADGLTGKTLRSAPTPVNPNRESPANRFPRILGDCLLVANLSGQRQATELLLKDRYGHVWALDERLNPLWDIACETGHFPYPVDLDQDGREEIAVGYSLVDSDGSWIWTRDNDYADHADAVAVVDLNGDGRETVLWAASDEGLVLLDRHGVPRRRLRLGHTQNLTVANLRDDLPGLEIAVINFWKNQGILHVLNAEGEVIEALEPRAEHGSTIPPVNWAGDGVELLFLNPCPDRGGLYNGFGQRVVDLPADGHPVRAYDALQLTGDSRDELIVWDDQEVWIYTQDQPLPESGLVRVRRNGRQNESNYRSRVSIPER